MARMLGGCFLVLVLSGTWHMDMARCELELRVACIVHCAVYVDVDAAMKQRTQVRQQVAVVRKRRGT